MNTPFTHDRASGHATDKPAAAQPSNAKLGGSFDRATLFWILQIGGWSAFGAAMFRWGLSYLSVANALVNKVLLVAIGFSITLFFRFMYRIARARGASRWATAVMIAGLSVGGAAFWRESHTVLFDICFNAATATTQFSLVWIPFGTLVYDSLVLLTWSLLYYVINNSMELEQEKERSTKAELLAHSARLRALRSQLEPHFLFNTLNAISTLVAEGANVDAGRMITRLSDFLRLTLETNEQPEITVAEELEFMRRYLEIEQVRFGDRLAVAIDADPEVLQALVPTLVLQPLVENAVKHGVLPRESGGSVAIRLARRNGRLRICVENDGAGPSNYVESSRGVGLSNTAARLAELYGDNSRLSLDSPKTGGMIATIEIPFRTAPTSTSGDSSSGEGQ